LFQHKLLSLPARTKLLIAVLLGSSVVFKLIPGLITVLALKPGLTLPPNFFVWNIFTSGFVEIRLGNAVFNCLYLALIGSRLEPIWGSVEYIRFIGITNVFSSLFTFLVMILAYPLSNPMTWITAVFSGFSASIAGFSVAFKQLFPDYEIPLSGIRAKHIPLSLLVINFILCLCRVPHNLPFTFFGIMVSFTYLRFYQVKISDGMTKVVGDLNESFSFSSLFPEIIAPFVQVLANTVFAFLKVMNCCKNAELSHENLQNRAHNTNDDAERRRGKALRSLEQRMQLESEFNVQNDSTQATPTDN